jgi:beta-glucosidase
MVLLKNNGDTLPLSRGIPLILVAGQAADDVGLQSGGSTTVWKAHAGNMTPGRTLLMGIWSAVAENAMVWYDSSGGFDAVNGLDAGMTAEVGIAVLAEEP